MEKWKLSDFDYETGERRRTTISKKKISRRDFLKTAGAGAAAAGMAGMAGRDLLGQIFPRGVQAAKKPVEEPKIPIDSAVIIGAGVGGLTAASLIADHGDTVTVIEDCHRPGGRLQVGTFPNGQHFSAAGSEWFACDTEFQWLVEDYLGFPKSAIGTWNADTYVWERGGEVERRFALISLDNSVEV